jgi:hypothetical protein
VDTRYAIGVGTTLPTVVIRWLNHADVPYDFSTGWTLASKVAPLADRENVLTIASTITTVGSVSTSITDPNVEVTFSTTNLTELVAGYEVAYGELTRPVAMLLYVTATRTGDSLPMRFAAGDEPVFRLLPTLTT